MPVPTPVTPLAPVADVYAELVRDASGGDPRAMERLLTRVQEVAWRFSVAVCGHADDAEDAMQEALIKTYRYTASIREPEAFRPWLHRTVRNACLMNRRRRAHEPKHFAGPVGIKQKPCQVAGCKSVVSHRQTAMADTDAPETLPAIGPISRIYMKWK